MDQVSQMSRPDTESALSGSLRVGFGWQRSSCGSEIDRARRGISGRLRYAPAVAASAAAAARSVRGPPFGRAQVRP